MQVLKYQQYKVIFEANISEGSWLLMQVPVIMSLYFIQTFKLRKSYELVLRSFWNFDPSYVFIFRSTKEAHDTRESSSYQQTRWRIIIRTQSNNLFPGKNTFLFWCGMWRWSNNLSWMSLWNNVCFIASFQLFPKITCERKTKNVQHRTYRTYSRISRIEKIFAKIGPKFANYKTWNFVT